jgi:hypothetical protein
MELIRQFHITEDSQGILLTEFSLKNNSIQNDKLIIDKFLKSKHYTIDCLPDFVKNDTKHPDFYLRQLFNDKQISITDFKELKKEEIFDFFEQFSNHDDWGEDKGDFKILLEKFNSIINNYESNRFYLISKDWFGEGSDKIRKPENWIYIYYFLIIWIDRINKYLMVCEWNYD